MKIIIGNDHGGYGLKLDILKYLKEREIEYQDVGSHSNDIVRYPYYAVEVAEAVRNDEDARGILICSTGIGMSIAANRFKGIRAALCTDSYMAEMTRRHNDSNILCLGGKITAVREALEIVEIWLNTDYEGGRHDISLDLISKLEMKTSRDLERSEFQEFIEQKSGGQ